MRACAAPPAAAPSLADTPAKALTAGIAPLLSCEPGVYAVYNSAGALQYVGLSRKMNASLAIHLAELPEGTCASVKLLPQPQAGKEALQAAWRAWVEEAVAAAGGDVPPGNTPDGSKAWTVRRPGGGGKPELRLTSGRGLADLTVPLSSLIDDVVKGVRVVAFVKGTRLAPECGFSKRLLGCLEETGVAYEVCNVLDTVYNPGLRDELKSYSQWPTLPQLYAGGVFVGGSDLVAELHESGQLKALLEKR